MTPELKRHLEQIAQSNRLYRARVADAEDGLLDEMARLLGIAACHCRIAAEAACLRNRVLSEEHIGHARNAFVLAIKTRNELPRDDKTGESPTIPEKEKGPQK